MAELTPEYLDERLDELLHVVKEGFDATASKEELQEVKERLTRVEATMVTKSYLDDKLADLKGDLIVKLRRADDKINFVIQVLRGRALLSEDDYNKIQTDYQIFPTLSQH